MTLVNMGGLIISQRGASFQSAVGLAGAILGIYLAALFPIAHMIWYKYFLLLDVVENKHVVFRNNCSCSCWDTIFEGPDSLVNDGTVKRTQSKSIYFNVDRNTLTIWIITVCGIILAYETGKRAFNLISAKKARSSMVILTIAHGYALYYAWWTLFNYINDHEFDKYFQFEIMMTSLKVVTAFLVFYHLDSSQPVDLLSMLIVLNFASLCLVHAVCQQVLGHAGPKHTHFHQVLRDFGFLATDVLSFVGSIYEIRRIIIFREDGAASPTEILGALKKLFLINVILLLIPATLLLLTS